MITGEPALNEITKHDNLVQVEIAVKFHEDWRTQVTNNEEYHVATTMQTGTNKLLVASAPVYTLLGTATLVSHSIVFTLSS